MEHTCKKYTQQYIELFAQLIWRRRLILENGNQRIPLKYRVLFGVRDMYADLCQTYKFPNAIDEITTNPLSEHVYEILLHHKQYNVCIPMSMRDDVVQWAEEMWGGYLELAELASALSLNDRVVRSDNLKIGADLWT